MAGEAFGIEKEGLEDLLLEAQRGELQLPEFQRGWVWPVENMTGLLASISLSYPVGTLMMLRTGGEGVRFKPRMVEGVTHGSPVEPERLLLDGQQRVTSLYQALLFDEPIRTKNAQRRPVSGWYYVDIEQVLKGELPREEAIRFLPPDRVVKTFRGEIVEDYSSSSLEYAAALFPLRSVFEPEHWQEGFLRHWDVDRTRFEQWTAFNRAFVQPFQKYQMPVIELGKNTAREAVCQVFEKVNTGGVTLTVFELLTATFAAEEFDLREDWAERKTAISGDQFKILKDFKETDFIQSITLLATKARREVRAAAGEEEEERLPRIGCRREEMLGLRLDEYKTFAPRVVEGLKSAAKFLHTQRIFDPKFLPYGSQLVPLAAILAELGSGAESQGARDRLSQWFWCGVLGELYGGTTETRFARDLPEVLSWVRADGPVPRTIGDANFAASRLLTLQTRGSAAYKGIYAILVREGASDWRTGEESNVQTYFDQAVDIHHIFPASWCQKQKLPRARWNSVVNKTPLAAKTNRMLGGDAPSKYHKKLVAAAGGDELKVDANVGSHFIDQQLLWADDFDSFFVERARALLTQIEGVTGKAVIRDDESVLPTDEELDVEDDSDL